MHLAVEVRQVVLARPVADLVLVAARSAVAVGAVAVVLLQELLVLALQVLLQDYAPDLEGILVLAAEASLLLAVRRIEIRIVVDVAGPTDAGVDCVGRLVAALQSVRLKQVSALLREDQTVVVAKVDGLDEPFGVEIRGCRGRCRGPVRAQCERANGGQRTAVFAVQLVDSITIDHQLAVLSAWQIEVVHQAVARILIVPVALAVHPRPFVTAIPLAVFARITSSSVGHRSLLALVLLLGLSVKPPWQLLPGVVQGVAEAPGRFAAAFQCVVAWEPDSGR